MLKQNENGLWIGSVVQGANSGKVGHFPFTLVEILDSAAYDDEISSLHVKFEAEMDNIYGSYK